MLPCDDELDEPRRAYEHARTARRVFEMVAAAATLLVTAMLGLGTGGLAAVYTYLAMLSCFLECVRRGLRQFGRATHSSEAGELAKAAPFCNVAAFALAWLGARELLLATGALSQPFGRTTAWFLTAVLLANATIATAWLEPASGYVDAASVLAWLTLSLPTAAPVPASLARVTALFLLQFALAVRDEGRLSPARWQLLTRDSGVHMAGVAANMAAFRLVQTAWTMHCPAPVLLPVLVVFLAALQELRANMMPSPGAQTTRRNEYQQTSPPASPRSVYINVQDTQPLVPPPPPPSPEPDVVVHAAEEDQAAPPAPPHQTGTVVQLADLVRNIQRAPLVTTPDGIRSMITGGAGSRKMAF